MPKKNRTRKGYIPWGKLFQSHRQELGLTVEEVSSLLDVPRGTIITWEAGNNMPHRSRWELVGVFLGWEKMEAFTYFLSDKPKSTAEDMERVARAKRAKVVLSEAKKEAAKRRLQRRFTQGYHAHKKGGKGG